MGRHSDSTTYKQEFFDREYSAKEAYGRLWGFTRKYRFRICLGVLCGMLTAGTLLPLFHVIQPALDKVSAAKVEVADAQGRDPPAKSEMADAQERVPPVAALSWLRGMRPERDSPARRWRRGWIASVQQAS